MRVLPIEDDRTFNTTIRQALRGAACAMSWVLRRETPMHTAESEASSSPRSISGVPRPTAKQCLERLRAPGCRLAVIIGTARD